MIGPHLLFASRGDAGGTVKAGTTILRVASVLERWLTRRDENQRYMIGQPAAAPGVDLTILAIYARRAGAYPIVGYVFVRPMSCTVTVRWGDDNEQEANT